jgi:hypothetical protein
MFVVAVLADPTPTSRMTSELPSVSRQRAQRPESVPSDVDADRRYPVGSQHGSDLSRGAVPG